jgi:hypothetical protein
MLIPQIPELTNRSSARFKTFLITFDARDVTRRCALLLITFPEKYGREHLHWTGALIPHDIELICGGAFQEPLEAEKEN